MVRIARIGRLYKLVKLTRLLRVLKIFKDQNKLIKKLTGFLKIGIGFERLFFFMMIFLLALHILSCLNITFAALYSTDIPKELQGSNNHSLNYTGTWLEKF